MVKCNNGFAQVNDYLDRKLDLTKKAILVRKMNSIRAQDKKKLQEFLFLLF